MNRFPNPLYIFDLDGTLALIDHRRSIIEEPGRDDDKWSRFYAACDKDAPNLPVLELLNSLYDGGADILIFSGRSDEVRRKTVDWLALYTLLPRGWLNDECRLVMRRAGDFTPDEKLKRAWLRGMLDSDRARLQCVFDDRAKVVAMRREEGVCCLQVAPGEF